jgi:shikimate kinase
MRSAPRKFFTQNPIFLIGMMGSGKSTIGKQLARLMGWPFIDLDRFIEGERGISIPTLFARNGEYRFRMLERAALLQILEEPGPRIVACGGGTPCFFDNLERMKEAGWVVYLETPISVLLPRIAANAAQRPLLEGANPAQKLEELLSQRERWYLQAHVVYRQREEGMPVAEELYRNLIRIGGH